MAIREFKELRVYQQSYDAPTTIFEHSKGWPKEETYSLTDQIRRSSRSVCANIAEAWRKRRYENHFVSKLSDADAEAAETRTWLQFGRDSGYLSEEAFESLDGTYDRICGGLVNMMKDPDPWCGPDIAHEPSIPYDLS
ncbi:MAG: four helix bundle protein [Salinibacter sp.]